MTHQVNDYSGDDACPIPQVDHHSIPRRQTGARRHARSPQRATSPTGFDPIPRRPRRQIVAGRRRINWWIVAGAVAILLAAGLVVAGAISSQTRPGTSYESVYRPQDSRQPVPR
ncbi:MULTISPECIES: hypothetical protein [Rhodococcus]|uniref:Uncharacterized protein n=1 Tax=Rhodococcus rhodochrous TaxID=1829 RepID=A0AAW4XMD3_RHORH|nr:MULTISPECIES: hypothetical protein [Rhodococcus]MCD2114848.1 hypothetical protein [Rhodococcus rhodochrous]MCZ1075297.1 hypothetical protein [Rhodococcus sp. A5(2022)]